MSLPLALKNTKRLSDLFSEKKEFKERFHKFVYENFPFDNIRCFSRKYSNNLLDDSIFKAIQNSMFWFSFLADSYARLVGQSLYENSLLQTNSHKEKKLMQVMMGSLAVTQDLLCDDFSDTFSNQDLDNLFYDPESYSPRSSLDAVTLDIYKKALQIFPKEKYPYFYDTLTNLHEIQKESKVQTKQVLSPTNLWDLSLKKGSYTAILIGQTIKPYLQKEDKEYAALASLGFYQIIDDIEDRSQDQSQNIQTPATVFRAQELLDKFTSVKKDSFKLFTSLPYAKKSIDSFLFRNHVFSLPAIESLKKIINDETPPSFRKGNSLSDKVKMNLRRASFFLRYKNDSDVMYRYENFV